MRKTVILSLLIFIFVVSCLPIFQYNVSNEEFLPLNRRPYGYYHVLGMDTLLIDALVRGASKPSPITPVDIRFTIMNINSESMFYDLHQLSISVNNFIFSPDSVLVGGNAFGRGNLVATSTIVTIPQGKELSIQIVANDDGMMGARQFDLYIGTIVGADSSFIHSIDTIHFLAN